MRNVLPRGPWALLVVVAALVVGAGIAVAGPPLPQPMQLTLACSGSGTYSYLENVVLFNKAGQAVSTPVSLECGLANNPFPSAQGFPSSVSVDVTAKVAGWGWTGTWWCANAAAPGGGGEISAFASSSPLPKGKNPAARCQAPSSTSGSDVYLQFG